MKIDSLTIENFKCFKTEKTFDFGRITVLTGANSSGKSSVMYAALVAIQSDGFPNKLNLNGSFVELGDFKEISNNHKIDNIIKIGFSFKKIPINTFWEADKIDNFPKLMKIEAVTINGILNDLNNVKKLSLQIPIGELRSKRNFN